MGARVLDQHYYAHIESYFEKRYVITNICNYKDQPTTSAAGA